MRSAVLTLNNGIVTLAFKDGSKRTFSDSTDERLTSIVDRNGNTTSVAYDSTTASAL